MLPHNSNVNEKANHSHLGQCCRVCETTEEHDCCVAEMTNLSKRGFNTTLAVFDKSTNTLSRLSWAHLSPHERINKAMEYRNIVTDHADNSTKHIMINNKVSCQPLSLTCCDDSHNVMPDNDYLRNLMTENDDNVLSS